MDSIAPALDTFLSALVIGAALIGVVTVAFVLLVESRKAKAVSCARAHFGKGAIQIARLLPESAMREKVPHSGESWGYLAR